MDYREPFVLMSERSLASAVTKILFIGHPQISDPEWQRILQEAEVVTFSLSR